MSGIASFRSRAELAAEESLATFVDHARRKPNPFGEDNRFEDDTWDISQTTKATGIGRARISFTVLGSAPRDHSLLPIEFRDFAKAYLIARQQLAPARQQQQRLSAVRALEVAVRCTDSRLSSLGPHHFDRAATILKEHFSVEAAYRVGIELGKLAQYLAEERLIASPFQWKSHLPRPRGAGRVGPAHEDRRARKLPTDAQLDAVTLAFRRAVHPSDRLVAAIAALLCSAPVRIGEVLRMRAACEVETLTAKGEQAFGLRWWTEKGVDPEVRWILPVMVPTAKAAISVIKELTAEAREIAAWYEGCSSEIYLPTRFAHLRNEAFVSLEDASALLGLSPAYCPKHLRLRTVRVGGQKGFWFREFQSAVLAKLPRGFPVVEEGTRLRATDALFVVRLNEFRTDRMSSACMIEFVSQAQVRDCLGGRVKYGEASLFSRLGIVGKDGAPVKINSHSFRHFLNTLAQRRGADPLDIAKWSGRKKVGQNAAYDHVSGDELLEDLSNATGIDLVAPEIHLPVTRSELAAISPGAAHVTEFGLCLHDFAMLPCELHTDCVNCSEHVCVKGDRFRAERLAKLVEETTMLLARAEEGAESVFEGADRWRDHQARTLRHAQQLLALLSDPAVPDGSIVRIDGHGNSILSAAQDRLPSPLTSV